MKKLVITLTLIIATTLTGFAQIAPDDKDLAYRLHNRFISDISGTVYEQKIEIVDGEPFAKTYGFYATTTNEVIRYASNLEKEYSNITVFIPWTIETNANKENRGQFITFSITTSGKTLYMMAIIIPETKAIAIFASSQPMN